VVSAAFLRLTQRCSQYGGAALCARGGFSTVLLESLRTAANPRRRGPTAVRYLYDALQRSSAVRCRACAAIPTDKSAGSHLPEYRSAALAAS